MSAPSRWAHESDVEYKARLLEYELVEVSREQDPGEDEWPYPDVNVVHALPESLVDAVRTRLGKPSADVELRERQISGGYSEYTQETDYEHELVVDGAVVFEHSGGYCSTNGLVALLGWLDEPAAS